MKISLVVSLLGTVLIWSACATKSIEVEPKKEEVVEVISPDTEGDITDLMLLYHGGTHRLDYTEEQLRPYIYRTSDESKHEWLFDGFLFIEFMDNRGFAYANAEGRRPANKAQWVWLTSRNFEKGRGVHALNSSLQKLSEKNTVPKRMRKVILTMPEPIIGNKIWGDVDGRNLDFDKAEDRIAACKWYADYVIEKWKEQGFDQLHLKGFYWVPEMEDESEEILVEIGKHIRSKGLEFYWIPYMYAKGAADWKKMGFDHAYQQPNYFFRLDRPKSLFTKAIEMGNNHDMGLEMEFDSRVSQPEFRQRFYDYLTAFKDGEVWKSKPVAYYEGGGTWLELSKGSSDYKKMYNDLSDIVVERQKIADQKMKSN